MKHNLQAVIIKEVMGIQGSFILLSLLLQMFQIFHNKKNFKNKTIYSTRIWRIEDKKIRNFQILITSICTNTTSFKMPSRHLIISITDFCS